MRGVLAAAGAVVMATAAVAGEGRREPGAHEHGRSTLEIAVEGGRVVLALASPGADIVGFEHAAATDAQRAEVERAGAALAEPLALFAFPQDAGCRLASADVALESEEGGHDGHEHAAAEHEEAGHAEFRAAYALDCADPAALAGQLDLAPFFARFPGAGLVEVRVVTARGQASREATREAPTLSLDPAG